MGLHVDDLFAADHAAASAEGANNGIPYLDVILDKLSPTTDLVFEKVDLVLRKLPPL